MALPNSRDITLAPGTEIPSTLLNNLQDMIIGGRHGPIRRISPASIGKGEFFDSSTVPSKWQITTPGLNINLDSTTQGEFVVPCLLADGEKLNDCFAHCSSLTIGDDVDASMTGSFGLFGVAVAHNFTTTARERFALDVAGAPITIDNTEQYGAYFASRAANASRVNVYWIDYEVEF